MATVRGWLRRLAVRAEALRSAFTALACELDADPLLPGPSGSAAADAVTALLAAYTAGKAIADESSARAAVTEVTTE